MGIGDGPLSGRALWLESECGFEFIPLAGERSTEVGTYLSDPRSFTFETERDVQEAFVRV